MPRWMTALATACVLAVPASAQAGGWATVELSSTADGVRAGETWVVDLTVLQHGRTPLEGVRPAITITRTGGGATRSLPARPTGKPGVYRARVRFPGGGRWEYAVDDGFGQRHDYPPVQISARDSAQIGDDRPAQIGGTPAAAPETSAPDDGGSLWPAIAAAIAAGLGAAALTTVLRRRTARRGDDTAAAES